MLGLVALSALVWLGSAAFSVLLLVTDSLTNAGGSGDSTTAMLGNHVVFGWMVPALVLLVGLLGAEALGKPKALGVSAAILMAQTLVVAATFVLLG